MSLTKEVKEFSFVIEPEDSDSYLESSVYVIASNHANVTSYSDKDTNTIRSIDVITDKNNYGNAANNYIVINYDHEEMEVFVPSELSEKDYLQIIGAWEFDEFIRLMGIYALSQGYLDRHIDAIKHDAVADYIESVKH